MGIDRQDVRIVCHFNMPKSMESFYQESGRAGRDQQAARSILYYGLDDRRKMEFLLKKSANKKAESSSASSTNLAEKSLADFNQIVDYCEGHTCRRKKILESFGEMVSSFICQRTCDICKHPNQVSAQLQELLAASNFRKISMTPISIQSFRAASVDTSTEFWNREDKESVSDEDISNSDDEKCAANIIVASKISSTMGIDKRLEALERAEEAYYRSTGKPKKTNNVGAKRAITESLRDSSKTSLLKALWQAEERLPNLQIDFEASAGSLETECFKKYEKVGKTFYCSQVAATVRWLSSSSRDQIHDRLHAPSPAQPTLERRKSDPVSSTRNTDEVETMPTAGDEALEETSMLTASPPSERKTELPPIPTFAEFAAKKGKRSCAAPPYSRTRDAENISSKNPEKRSKIMSPI